MPSEKFQELLCIYVQRQLWQEVYVLLLLRALKSTNLTYLSHRLACISYPFQTGRQGAKNVLQLEIKICNIWESPCQNYLTHLCQGVPKKLRMVSF